MEWVRRYVRRHTRPIPRGKARLFRDRLSIAYYLIGWSTGGVALFQLMTCNPDTLPQNLDIHADPSGLHKQDVHRAADLIRKASYTPEVTILNLRNFSVESVVPYKTKSLKQQIEDTENRAKKDFFGNPEESQNEDQYKSS